jgi:hypothetical protein
MNQALLSIPQQNIKNIPALRESGDSKILIFVTHWFNRLTTKHADLIMCEHIPLLFASTYLPGSDT